MPNKKSKANKNQGSSSVQSKQAEHTGVKKGKQKKIATQNAGASTGGGASGPNNGPKAKTTAQQPPAQPEGIEGNPRTTGNRAPNKKVAAKTVKFTGEPLNDVKLGPGKQLMSVDGRMDGPQQQAVKQGKKGKKGRRK